jgi:hypothetical protein
VSSLFLGHKSVDGVEYSGVQHHTNAANCKLILLTVTSSVTVNSIHTGIATVDCYSRYRTIQHSD